MIIQCGHCESYDFQIDFGTSTRLMKFDWVFVRCAKCKAMYQITLENPKGKRLKGEMKIKDVTIPCPQCKKFDYNSEWNKDTQLYDHVCEDCGYKESRTD